MSDFTSKEAVRLKNALRAKHVIEESSVQETNLKQAGGLTLWENTRDAAKQIVEELNQGIGHAMLVWRSARSVEINVIAPEFTQHHNLLATFHPDTFKVAWMVGSSPQGGQIMTLDVVKGELMWMIQGQRCTAQEAAEKLIRALTSTI